MGGAKCKLHNKSQTNRRETRLSAVHFRTRTLGWTMKTRVLIFLLSLLAVTLAFTYVISEPFLKPVA